MNEFNKKDMEIIKIVQEVAREEGLEESVVLDCWKEFRSLPLDTQDRMLRYFDDGPAA